MLPVLPKAPQRALVAPGKAIDGFGRRIDYIRVSVTDRCNFRCVYCMPAEGYEWIPRPEVLTFEEITRVARIFVGLGVRRIRLTGGEPTVRKDVVELVGMLKAIEGLDDLSMTSNGLRLPQLAGPLVEAGLDRFNISLDSLDAARFAELTRGADLATVLAGIDAVLALGLDKPLKVNSVIVGGVNDDEPADLVRYFADLGRRVVVRFIEYMPFTDHDGWKGGRYVPLDTVRDRLIEELGIEPREEPVIGNGPAKYWQMPDSAVTVGFIHPVSDHFCAACNRVRLSADGELRPCLGHVGAVDLRAKLRDPSVTDEQILEAVGQALDAKPERHLFAEDPTQHKGVMTSIGG